MFRVAVCDDDKTVSALLETIILDYRSSSQAKISVDVFYSGEDLCAYIENGNRFDLIFLDIEMHALSGIDVGKRIRNVYDDYTSQIVYISGRDSYYREMFDVQPLHFLSKPLDREQIISDLRLAMKLAGKADYFFTFKVRREVIKLPVREIIYFQSSDREIGVTSKSGEYWFYGKLDDVMSRLNKYRFLRIHKSYLINYDHVSRFRYHEVIMSNSDVLPISQSRRQEIRRLQMGYSVQKDAVSV